MQWDNQYNQQNAYQAQYDHDPYSPHSVKPKAGRRAGSPLHAGYSSDQYNYPAYSPPQQQQYGRAAYDEQQQYGYPAYAQQPYLPQQPQQDYRHGAHGYTQQQHQQQQQYIQAGWDAPASSINALHSSYVEAAAMPPPTGRYASGRQAAGSQRSAENGYDEEFMPAAAPARRNVAVASGRQPSGSQRPAANGYDEEFMPAAAAPHRTGSAAKPVHGRRAAPSSADYGMQSNDMQDRYEPQQATRARPQPPWQTDPEESPDGRFQTTSSNYGTGRRQDSYSPQGYSYDAVQQAASVAGSRSQAVAQVKGQRGYGAAPAGRAPPVQAAYDDDDDSAWAGGASATAAKPITPPRAEGLQKLKQLSSARLTTRRATPSTAVPASGLDGYTPSSLQRIPERSLPSTPPSARAASTRTAVARNTSTPPESASRSRAGPRAATASARQAPAADSYDEWSEPPAAKLPASRQRPAAVAPRAAASRQQPAPPPAAAAGTRNVTSLDDLPVGRGSSGFQPPPEYPPEGPGPSSGHGMNPRGPHGRGQPFAGDGPSMYPEEGAAERRVECGSCGRCFSETAYAKHAKICDKVFGQKRKVFNVAAQRLADLEAEKVQQRASAAAPPRRGQAAAQRPPTSAASTAAAAAAPARKVAPQKPPAYDSTPASDADVAKAKWQKQSNALRKMMQANRMIKAAEEAGIDVRTLNLPTDNEPDDRVPCPHCGRRYAPLVAERHIPKCQDIQAKPSVLRGHAGKGAYARDKVTAPKGGFGRF